VCVCVCVVCVRVCVVCVRAHARVCVRACVCVTWGLASREWLFYQVLGDNLPVYGSLLD
jgi:hypothetical protein